MRKAGCTYAEILKEVLVAKSTLSMWLRSVGLSKQQTQRITRKRIAAARRGAQQRRAVRLAELASHIERGQKQIGALTSRELWLIGVALYWAEGAKQRESGLSSGIMFGNSDPEMIRLFIAWLHRMGVKESDMLFELYVHETRRREAQTFKKWWAQQVGIATHHIYRLYFKRGNVNTNRKNTGDLYHGLLRVKVRQSTSLNRQITGWTQGIVAALGSGVIGNTSAFGAEDSRFDP